MASITPDWTGLPQDLLTMIAKRLHTRFYILRFRAVCRLFRSLIHPLPRAFSPHQFIIAHNPFILRLRESTVYAIQPPGEGIPKTWLVRVEEFKPGKLLVTHPLLGVPFKKLSKKLPNSLDLLGYQVHEICKVYGLESDSIHSYEKVVVSTCLDQIHGGFSIMTLKLGKVNVWRMGDYNWTAIDIGHDSLCFKDIVYHNKKIYALRSDGLTVTVNSKSLKIHEVAAPLLIKHGVSMYLVKSSNDLYLINKESLSPESGFHNNSDDGCHPVHLNVFKLDEDKRQWVNMVNGLDNIVLFVGIDCSFSLSAKEFAGCKENYVYFVDDKFSTHREYPRPDVGIFHLKGGDTARPLSSFSEYSKIFWPPPTWLKIKRNTMVPMMDFLTLSMIVLLLWALPFILSPWPAR